MFTVCNVIVHTWEHRNTDAKKTHKQIYDTCMWKHRKTHMFWQSRLARRAVNCCHDGPGHGWCRYSPQRLRIRSWPLTSTLQHQDNSLWFWHCNIKTWSFLWDQAYFTPFITRWRGQGGKLPQAFCSFAHLLGQEHAWFGHKKVVHKYATYTNSQK